MEVFSAFILLMYCSLCYALGIYSFYLAVQQGGKKQLLLSLNWTVLITAPIAVPIVCYWYRKDGKHGKK